MRWPWRRRAELCEPRRAVSGKVLELETAKEILAEVFGITIVEAEEMIKQRCLERTLWPEKFGPEE